MIRSKHCKLSARGFSLLELLIVVAITLLVATVAVPQMIVAAQNIGLRSTASSVSGLVQKARMLSVARNRSFPLASATVGSVTTVRIELNGNTSLDTDEETASSLRLPRGTTFDNTGNPSAATITLTPETTPPRFNSRGLPCFGNPCNVDPNKMYIAFLRQDRSFGGTGWAAINVTPPGRVQVWTWDGSAWK
jgi:prepilin-type N-terminal cleavage/methylation domain-containing protein